MVQSNATIKTTKIDYDFLWDVKTLLGFTCVLPLLKLDTRIMQVCTRVGNFHM